MNLVACLRIARPRQWLKNLLLFFPPFLSGALFLPGVMARGVVPFLAFCCVSSSAYIFNDLNDMQQDAMHPLKSRRPLASGVLSKAAALICSVILLTFAIGLAMTVSWLFLGYLMLYLLVSAAYSLFLKDQPIFDIFCIASGFVVRLYAGGAAFNVIISDWLFLTVFLLAIFLSVGKRCSERRGLGLEAARHRVTLGKYPDGFLESAMYLSGASVLVTYSLYVMTRPMLVYTVPLCLFGLLRYLYRVKADGEGDPTVSLLTDPILFSTGVFWAIAVGLSVYL